MSTETPTPATRTAATRIARVAVDMPQEHLDRWFDYDIPAALADVAQPGVRVRVPFAGKQATGFIIEVTDDTSRQGDLLPLTTVISPEPVLAPEQVRLCRAVADHWCGTFADVVRLAVPPRHAATEKATRSPWPVPEPGPAPWNGPLLATDFGAGFLDGLATGQAPRAFWQVPPVHSPVGDWCEGFAQAIAATLHGPGSGAGRRALVVVPDERDLARLKQALEDRFGAGTVATLHADLGPSVRYRNYLATSRGHARIVIGTRAAALAPVADCGLVAIWDDGDDLHAEPRQPYPHARDVLALRAVQQHAGLLVASRGRTAEVQRWVESGWLVPLALPRDQLRRATPAVKVAGADDFALARDPRARQVRVPDEAFATIRTGLTQGPVLVQVPRHGYAVALACHTCHTHARCATCHGPLRGHGEGRGLECGWCGRVVATFRCGTCGGTSLRAPVVGAERTVEEFGRAFPGIRVLESSRDKVVADVPDEPVLVVATVGAEPVAPTGYAAAVLLDCQLLLGRADLRASEEALRRWLNAVGLVRGGAAGGSVCAVGPSEARPLQALVRTDPATLAARELDDRREAGFPPARRFVQLDGTAEAIDTLVAAARLLPEPGLLPGAEVVEPLEHLDVLGPVPLTSALPQALREAGSGELQRLTLRVPPESGQELVRRVKAGLAVGSARHAPALRTQVDPNALG
ncbi:primosomal protein N' [Propionibacteriaceae bacterium G1746]|uniref:primosomal protein N' n=1 Tax=Aestuariimicrobium sp. G57 TaxID=3418485 RepID=UPI003C1BC8A5